MADVKGHQHYIQFSSTRQDSTTAETPNVRLYLRGGHGTTPMVPETYEDLEETSRESMLSERASIVLRETYSKQISCAADDYSLGLLPLLIAGDSSPTSGAQIGTDGMYEMADSGPIPITSNGMAAFTMQDIGYPEGEDDDRNVQVKNAILDQLVISIPESGPVDVSGTILGGETTELGGGPTSVTWARNRIFTRAHAYILSSATTGDNGTETYKLTAFDTNPTVANATTRTMLAGTPYNWGPYISSATITFNNNADPAISYVMGDQDGNGVGIVSGGLGGQTGASWTNWRRTGAGQTAQLSFRIRLTDATNYATDTLRSEFEARTNRGWEVWLWHGDVIGSSAYAGFRVTFLNMKPISYDVEPSMGFNYANLVYEACWDTSADAGWHLLTCSGHSAGVKTIS